MTFKIPPPPESRFGKWAYQLWDYVARNRLGAASNIVGTTPILVGTGSSGTFTVAHATSGVAAGTYGGPTIIPRFDISALGHVLSGTNAGTLGTFAGFNSFVSAADVLGTSTTGTFTAALSTTGVAAGTYGQADFSARLTIDAKGRISAATEVAITGGTGTGGSVADLNVNAPIQFDVGTGTGAVNQPFTLGHGTSGVTAGTYGAARITSQLVVDARGHVTSASQAGTLGTFAGFNSLVAAGVAIGTTTTGTLTTARNWSQVGAGDVLGTSPTATFTAALSTTGVVAGTYGAARLTAQLVLDAKGRVSSASNAGTLGTMAGFNSYILAGDVLGTSTTGTFTAALSTTGVTAGTYTAATVTVDAKGRLTAASAGASAALPDNVITGTYTVGANKSFIVAQFLEISTSAIFEIASGGQAAVL